MYVCREYRDSQWEEREQKKGRGDYINHVLLKANPQIAEQGPLIELAEGNHVINTRLRGRVHGFVVVRSAFYGDELLEKKRKKERKEKKFKKKKNENEEKDQEQQNKKNGWDWMRMNEIMQG